MYYKYLLTYHKYMLSIVLYSETEIRTYTMILREANKEHAYINVSQPPPSPRATIVNPPSPWCTQKNTFINKGDLYIPKNKNLPPQSRSTHKKILLSTRVTCV